MKKIVVIGSPSSGKSTFARKLRDRTGLPLYYLDQLWHRPDRTTAAAEEFDEALAEILQGDGWIVDGNYNRTLETRLQACDTVFLFDLPVEVCIAGAAARIGQKREDLPWVETEFDTEFRRWIEDFPRDQLPQMHALLTRYHAEKTVCVFKTRAEADAYLEQVSPFDKERGCVLRSELHTARCTLRRFEEGDIEAFMAYRNDPDWMQYQGFKGLTKQAYRDALLGEHALADGLQLAIVCRESNTLIGDLYLKAEGAVCWLGYSVCRERARQGYAHEAAAAAIAALRKAGFTCFKAGVEAGNAPSIALLKKLRFSYEGTADGELIFALRF